MCVYYIYRYPNFVDIVVFIYGNTKILMFVLGFISKVFNDNMFVNKIYKRLFNKNYVFSF